MTEFWLFNIYLLIWGVAGDLYFRIYKSNWPRWAWLIGIAIAIFLPQLHWQSVSEFLVILPEITIQKDLTSTFEAQSQLGTIIYISGMVVLLGHYVLQWRRVLRIKRLSLPIDSYAFEMPASSLNGIGPFSFFKWVFIPEGLSPEMHNCMLEHENVHRTSKHSWDLLLLQIIHLLTWFNPAVIFLRRGIQLAHEQEADAVAARSNGKVKYTNALLSAAFGLANIQSIVHPFTHKKHIKNRIHMLHQSKKRPVLLAIAVLFVSMLSLQACTSGALPEEMGIQEPDNNASYPGGMQALIDYMTDHMEYPAEAKANGVEGKIMISFQVEADGSITNAEVVKSLDPECDEAAINIVRNMPKWEPATKNGVAIASKMVLPVMFKLD
jgi:TonB family protein